MIINIINWFLAIAHGLGYGGVFFLMIIESSFLPMPSEVVIPPAAYLASQGELNIFLVILFGLLGSLIGAIINYVLAFYLGRAIIYRLSSRSWAKFLFISPQKVLRAEKYFLRNANSATFIGRFIPIIRQLVSLPAGFFKMNFFKFIFWTTLGSGLWIIILAALGYFIGANKELLYQYYHEISWGLLIIGIIAIIIIMRKHKK